MRVFASLAAASAVAAAASTLLVAQDQTIPDPRRDDRRTARVMC